MLVRNLLRPLGLSLFLTPPVLSEPPSSPLSIHRREQAARLLTIATTIQPVETTKALRLARRTLRQTSLSPYERIFLKSSLQDGVARGIACAAGGAAAGYAILKLVLHVIPLHPSQLIARAAVGIVSFGAAVVELAAFPDVTTVELLLIEDQGGVCARRSIETWNPDLVLLRTIDRHQGEHAHHVVHDIDLADTDAITGDYLDAEMQFR
eukprot:GFKZ01013250.1.p3 GENE.GFKZ01013250.1~~GFKZ01013250.1.p3  ORF type:complete len:209 (-),score=36.56 GFKZ01013250.1:1207-1833(-)